MEVELTYDRMGSRLRMIGAVAVDYDRFGRRPRQVGDWVLEYDRLGSRLRCAGPFELTYDLLGNRVRTIGPMTIFYDRLGKRPKQVGLSRRLRLTARRPPANPVPGALPGPTGGDEFRRRGIDVTNADKLAVPRFLAGTPAGGQVWECRKRWRRVRSAA